jgi:chemotaxis protein CheD
MPETAQSKLAGIASGAGAPGLVVGVGDVKVAAARDVPGRVIVTYALGSCIGLACFDPEVAVGGMLHYMLPQPADVKDATGKEAMYATTGLPLMLEQLERRGARRERLVLTAAGAAEVITKGRAFAIGQRNRTILRKLLWKLGLSLSAEETGGTTARTMSLSLVDGTVTIRDKGQERALWQP